MMSTKRLQFIAQQPEEPIGHVVRYHKMSNGGNGENMNDNDQIAGLGVKLTGLETKVTSLDTKVTNLETKVTNLDTKVTNLETKATGLEVKVTRLEVKVDNLENTMQEVKIGLRDLRNDMRNDISNLAITTDTRMNALDKKVDANFKWLLGVMITSGASAVMSIMTIATTIMFHFLK